MGVEIPVVSGPNPVCYVDSIPTWSQNGNNCPAWLTVVREACELLNHEYELTIGKWWAGGDVEEYDHFRVIHKDGQVTLVSKTKRGETLLREANLRAGRPFWR